MSLHQIALSYLSSFESLSPDPFLFLLSPSATHHFAPSSISLPPPLSPQTFASHIASLRTVLTAFPVTPKEIWTDEINARVTIWATSRAVFREDVKDAGLMDEEWEYHGEYIFLLEMDENRERIERVVEFVDSAGTERLRRLMERARRNCQGRE